MVLIEMSQERLQENNMEARIKRLEMQYNADHDLFDQPIQMNHIDAELLTLITRLHSRVSTLEARLAQLEPAVFSLNARGTDHAIAAEK